MNGLDICAQLRETDGSAVPIIMLTALGETDDRIAGLDERRRRLCDQAVQRQGAHARASARSCAAALSRRQPAGCRTPARRRPDPQPGCSRDAASRRRRACPDHAGVRPAALLPAPPARGVQPRGAAPSRCGAGSTATTRPSRSTSSVCATRSRTDPAEPTSDRHRLRPRIPLGPRSMSTDSPARARHRAAGLPWRRRSRRAGPLPAARSRPDNLDRPVDPGPADGDHRRRRRHEPVHVHRRAPAHGDRLARRHRGQCAQRRRARQLTRPQDRVGARGTRAGAQRRAVPQGAPRLAQSRPANADRRRAGHDRGPRGRRRVVIRGRQAVRPADPRRRHCGSPR